MTIDYLVIGHASKDLTPDGPMLGGTVSYCALTAHALGQQVAILTSAPYDMTLLAPLEQLGIQRVQAKEATTFEIRYTPQGRVMHLRGRATPLAFDHLPIGWHHPRIVHLAPIADEITPSLLNQFPEALMGVTPQGWMRQWDEQSGLVQATPWYGAGAVLGQANVVVMSIEDLNGQIGLARQYATQLDVMVVTYGADPVLLMVEGEEYQVAVPQVDEVNATGAGDIFTAAFLIRLHHHQDPILAARFAAYVASASVTRQGMESIPGKETIEQAYNYERSKA